MQRVAVAPVAVAAVLVVLALAGCGGPRATPDVPAPTLAAPMPPRYELRVMTVQERSDGAPLHAEVQATPLRSDGTLGLTELRHAGRDGLAVFTYWEPTTVLVRAIGPEGWTSEGARVEVGETVEAPGFTASERDVFLPLFRDRLDLAAQATWSNTVPTPGGDGVPRPASVLLDLDLPEGVADAYLARLANAEVTLRWEDGAASRASLAAGLAADGEVLASGDESGPSLLPGGRQAHWSGAVGALPPGSVLQAAAVTRTAVVGDILLDVTVVLDIGGLSPPELPAQACHATLCPAVPPLPPS